VYRRLAAESIIVRYGIMIGFRLRESGDSLLASLSSVVDSVIFIYRSSVKNEGASATCRSDF